MHQDWMNALIGGVIIGISVSLMLLWNGRTTGISGIIYGAFSPTKGDTHWRVLFILGLIAGGFTLKAFNPNVFSGSLQTENWTTIIAGLLVGIGTILGSGCTSGHGVCGLSRLSIRSLVATISFIAAGVMAVVVYKKLGVFL